MIARPEQLADVARAYRDAELCEPTEERAQRALYVVPNRLDADALLEADFAACSDSEPARLLDYAREVAAGGFPIVLVGKLDPNVRNYILTEVPHVEFQSLALPITTSCASSFLGYAAPGAWDSDQRFLAAQKWLALSSSDARTEAAAFSHEQIGKGQSEDGNQPESAPWTPPEAAELFPEHLIAGDDLLSQVVQYGIQSATRPQPAMALGAAITMFGAIVGRRVESATGLRTNFYVVNIGGTGSGKDAGRKMTKALLNAAGLPHLVGPAGFTSDSGIRCSLEKQPSQLAMVDEFGIWLKQFSGPRQPPHVLGIRKLLLELFGSANSTVAPMGYGYTSVKDHSPPPLHEPNLCLLGTAVPENVFDALTSAAVEDGFLNRCLVFAADVAMPVARLRGLVTKPPAELVASIKALDEATRPTGVLASLTTDGSTATGCRKLEYDEDAWAELEAVEAEQRERMASGGGLANLWGRYLEHVGKVALLRSVLRDPTAENTSAADLRWARELVSWCIGRLAFAARDRLADSPIEADTKKVLRLIRDAGEKGLTQAMLTRKLQWLDGRARVGILATLIESGQIKPEIVPSERTDGKGKPTTVYRAIGD